MRCTSKISKLFATAILSVSGILFCGCGRQEMVSFDQPYLIYDSPLNTYEDAPIPADFFAEDLCVTEDINFGTEKTHSTVAEAAGVFNLSNGEVTYSQNLFERLYPASTTKILTAYIILRDCNPEELVTVSERAVDQASDSSVVNLNKGDMITIQDLLYGLMLASGNDAAIALAEQHSGSVEAFCDEMNRTAKSLGATGSHFTNPNGLPDENHYTTVYDMYLLFKEAIKLPQFVALINSPVQTVSYWNEAGNQVEQTWKNTNRYLTGAVEPPDGFTVIGGKTGTTNAAGYCLALYSQNDRGEDIVSIVFKADGRSNLYLLMNEILSGFAK